jgi:hypothetical protein
LARAAVARTPGIGGPASAPTPAAGWPVVRPVTPVVETTTQAIARLDAQFPWLRQAEKRAPRR